MSCGTPMPQQASKESAEIVYLNSLIDKSQSDALNADPSYPLSNLYSCGDAKYVKSDADEQLIFNFVFA